MRRPSLESATRTTVPRNGPRARGRAEAVISSDAWGHASGRPSPSYAADIGSGKGSSRFVKPFPKCGTISLEGDSAFRFAQRRQGSFRLAALCTTERVSVPTQRVLIWIVFSQGDAAEDVEEMYGATERRLVSSIIKAQSLRAQKCILRQALFLGTIRSSEPYLLGAQTVP
jgi:hypothetical protein